MSDGDGTPGRGGEPSGSSTPKASGSSGSQRRSPDVPVWVEDLGDWARDAARRRPDGTPGPLVIAGGLLAGAVLLFGVVIPVVAGLAHAVRGGTEHAWSWAVGWQLPRVVTDPVRHYLDTHSAGLPVSADVVWSAWAITGVVLLVLAACRSVGARIGWVLFGTTTAAMVYAGTVEPDRFTAAGVAVVGWSLLSVVALRGLGRRTRPDVVVVPSSRVSD
jgi:hypothetical protein